MGNVRVRPETGMLFLDFQHEGQRRREQTMLPDTAVNRKRLQKVIDSIESDIANGVFDYEATFNKKLPPKKAQLPSKEEVELVRAQEKQTPSVSDFAELWYAESQVSWRRSYKITQRGALDKYILPFFKDRMVSSITKADVLAFRASLSKVPARKANETLSNRRINSIMKPMRQILNEAADRFEFNSAFRSIKPLKMKRSDVHPFTLDEVQQILNTVRADFTNYFTVRFLTGMRTGEVHGLKWKYIDFERRLILVRESIVLNEEDELKTDGSIRDIQMNELVYKALQAQFEVTSMKSEYVFCQRNFKPIDNKNFLNRVWTPLLRHLEMVYRRPYQMRHTAATLWLAAGEAPEWIARQLGHTSTEMLFRVYSRYVPNLTRRDGSAMDRLLGQHMMVVPVSGILKMKVPGNEEVQKRYDFVPLEHKESEGEL